MRKVVQLMVVVEAPDDMDDFEIQERLLGNLTHEGITIVDPKVSLYATRITHGQVDVDSVPVGPRVEPQYRTLA